MTWTAEEFVGVELSGLSSSNGGNVTSPTATGFCATTGTYTTSFAVRAGSANTFHVVRANQSGLQSFRIAIDLSSGISAYGLTLAGTRTSAWDPIITPLGDDIYSLAISSTYTAGSATISVFPARGLSVGAGSLYFGKLTSTAGSFTSATDVAHWTYSNATYLGVYGYATSWTTTSDATAQWTEPSNATAHRWHQVSGVTDADDGVDFQLLVNAEFPAFNVQSDRPVTITSTPSENP